MKGQEQKKHITAIQYMGMMMRLQQLNIDYVLSLVQIVNYSYLSAKDVITILEQIFKNEKSAKILLATQILQYLVKNCNWNFHQAANKESFQKCILGLLKRQRGKMNLIKELRSNSQNWSKIQSRILYLVQLWYDAFILEQTNYPNIINTYKILRKQNIVFPPRNVNEKSLLAIKTDSPIFDNIETIAQSDKQKFKKRLKAMGLTKLSQKFQQKDQMMKVLPVPRQINIDQVSQKIAIIQSQDYDPEKVIKAIEQVKRAIQFGKVKLSQQKYWKQIKQAAQIMINQWQQKNAKLIQNKQQLYLQAKMHGRYKKSVSEQQNYHQTQYNKVASQKEQKRQTWDLLGDDPTQNQKKENKKLQEQVDEWGDFTNSNPIQQLISSQKVTNQMNLLDL